MLYKYNRFFCVENYIRVVDFFIFAFLFVRYEKKMKCVIYINVNQRCDFNVENFIYTKRRYVNFDLCDMCSIEF